MWINIVITHKEDNNTIRKDYLNKQTRHYRPLHTDELAKKEILNGLYMDCDFDNPSINHNLSLSLYVKM